MEKIEHVIDQPIVPAGLEVVLECGKIRDAVLVERSNLAVKNGVVIGKRRAGLGYRRKSLGPIEPVAGLQRYRATVDPGLNAIAVELDLMDPVVAGGGRGA